MTFPFEVGSAISCEHATKWRSGRLRPAIATDPRKQRGFSPSETIRSTPEGSMTVKESPVGEGRAQRSHLHVPTNGRHEVRPAALLPDERIHVDADVGLSLFRSALIGQSAKAFMSVLHGGCPNWVRWEGKLETRQNSGQVS
jgi:hypothetical protein